MARRIMLESKSRLPTTFGSVLDHSTISKHLAESSQKCSLKWGYMSLTRAHWLYQLVVVERLSRRRRPRGAFDGGENTRAVATNG